MLPGHRRTRRLEDEAQRLQAETEKQAAEARGRAHELAEKQAAEARGRAHELAEKTYSEVLDATKHQDDKVNRFLVAIAFLTTGAIALIFKPELLRIRYEAEGHGMPLLAIAAGGYLATTTVAVVLLLMALSSVLKLAGRKPAYPKADEAAPLTGSLLYFQMIGSRPLNMWMKMWDRPASELETDLTTQYLREAHNLSERARVKYSLTDEAAAIYIYGLMYLSVGFLLGVHALQRPPKVPSVVDLAGWPAGLLAGVAAAHAILQLYNLYQHERSSAQVSWLLAAREARRGSTTARTDTLMEAARRGDAQYWIIRSTIRLIAPVAVYVVAAALIAVGNGPVRWIAAVVCALSAVLAGAIIWPRFRQIHGDRKLFVPIAGAICAVSPFVLAHQWHLYALLLVILPPTALSGFTAARQLLNFHSEVVRYRNRLLPEDDATKKKREAVQVGQRKRVLASQDKALKGKVLEESAQTAPEAGRQPTEGDVETKEDLEASLAFEPWRSQPRR